MNDRDTARPTVVEIGHEMPFWGDGDQPDDPVVARIVGGLVDGGRSVLVAGPHPADVLRAAASGGGPLTVLTRGLSDAEAAGTVLGEGRATLLTGDVARADASGRFDVVVAAGGLEQLSSADAELRTWAELLTLVAALVEDGGTLLVGAAQDVGLQVLAGTHDRHRDDEAAVWFPDLGFDDTRPSGADELRVALAEAVGCEPGSGAAWSLVPGLRSVDLAISPTVPVRGRTLLSARVAASLRRVFPDPRGFSTRLPAAGRFHTLPPAVLAVAGRSAPTGLDVVATPALGSVAAIDATRSGSSVELALLDACLAFDLPRVRATVDRYAAALADTATDADLATAVFLADDGGVVRLGPAGTDVDAEDALVAGIDAFSLRLAELGWRHPWPVGFDAVDVTRALLAGTGRELGRAEVLVARGAPRQTEPDEPDRLRREVEAMRSRELWFESTLRQRDAQLAAANVRAARLTTPAQKQANRRRAKPLPAKRGPVARLRRIAGRVRRRLPA